MTDPKAMIVQLTVGELETIVVGAVARGVAQAANAGGARLVDPVLTTEQAAEELHMPVNVLRKRARAGIVPCFKIGALFRFRASELNAWMAQQPRPKKAG